MTKAEINELYGDPDEVLNMPSDGKKSLVAEKAFNNGVPLDFKIETQGSNGFDDCKTVITINTKDAGANVKARIDSHDSIETNKITLTFYGTFEYKDLQQGLQFLANEIKSIN